MISQQLYLKTMIEAWRTTNVWLSIWWMYNELWPTGGCARAQLETTAEPARLMLVLCGWMSAGGSIEYGSPVPGQLLGGRWKCARLLPSDPR